MDINCDFGEDFGIYSLHTSDEILNYVTSINVACGFHAGDPLVMAKTVEQAVTKGVRIGAHPGYADLQGFGRREMQLSPEEIKALVLYQIGALYGFVKAYGGRLHHVKPHGALYNQSANDPVKAQAVIDAVKAFDEGLVLYALAGSLQADMARAQGLTVYEEVFADRNYNADGTLVSRRATNAVIDSDEQMLAHVERIVREQKIIAIDGTVLQTNAKTICIHGDGVHALQFAQRVSNILK